MNFLKPDFVDIQCEAAINFWRVRVTKGANSIKIFAIVSHGRRSHVALGSGLARIVFNAPVHCL